ncbi:MAG: Pr6Pr family membrane protein [Micrococcales bacterium]|nr:Pr6Pr family membrane protein [Micrococcales bacterium]
MQISRIARPWHIVTFVVVLAALTLQLWLVIDGRAILVDGSAPGVMERVRRFFSYFTIQSNLLVAATTFTLARDPAHDGRLWRVARLASVVGIAVTGVVHWFLLRPLLDLSGGPLLADKLLHVAVPLLTVVGWLVFGPRGRATRADVWWALVWPVLWLLATLTLGPLAGWYPYPFLDAAVLGLGTVLLTCLGVAVLFVGLSLLAVTLDHRLRRTSSHPAADDTMVR